VNLHARTLEQLDMRGIADEVVAEGNAIPELQISVGESRVDVSRLDTRFGQLHVTPQGRIQDILTEHARRLGVRVEHGLRVTNVSSHDDVARVAVTDGTRAWTEEASYVVGCDGAHSTTRTALGIDFFGHTYPYIIVAADVRLREAPYDAVRFHVMPNGLVFSADFGNGWLRIAVVDRRSRWSADPVPLEEVRTRLVHMFGRDLGPSDPLWSARFRISERQAATYRQGRVLLAGDAAHVHSPLGGQGLNLGLQDAMNLGWKLATVPRGEAPDSLLDTYSAERRPVCKDVVRATDVFTRVFTSRNPLVRVGRRVVVPPMLRSTRGQRLFAGRLSGITTRYAGDGDAGRRVPDLSVVGADGARRPLFTALRSGRFVLVDASPDGTIAAACAPWAERVDVLRGRTVGARDFTRHEAILCRPDGYCAWAGSRADRSGLIRALVTWCGAPDAPDAVATHARSRAA
jgi:2-polyprenyl-6-methoxyphenol hydroxylase-like FAD-dependent oxidoreductase